MRAKLVLLAVSIMGAMAWAQTTTTPPLDSPTGGANSPKPGAPVKLILDRAQLSVGNFTIEVPTGNYTAPAGGATNYTVPGPIVRVKGPDGLWRGHSYLETYPRVIKFTGTADKTSATLTYEFEKDKKYEVKITVKNDAVQLDETSTLGPRNLWVFDCFYSEDAAKPWAPSAGFAVDATGTKHQFYYLPCFYDKPDVTVNPAHKAPAKADEGDVEPAPASPPAYGVAVTSSALDSKDLLGFWIVDYANWKNADAMGFQLWQRRQHPSDPASRHFLGPDTKSDSTPNPRTAALMGTSLYEGHVTIEFNLGVGSRKIAFAAPGKGPEKPKLADPFKTVMQGLLK